MKKLSDMDRIIGCIRGKAIGGTLGTPQEGKMALLDLTYYDPVPKGVLPNDDFDIQLLFLEAVEAHDGVVDTGILASVWAERMGFPYDEYGVATLNLNRGLYPPVSGWFDNPFKSCMGSPIRSELWALLAPKRPALAAYFALQDSIIDHGEESAAGEMFFSALESLAFSGEKNFRALIEKALLFISDATQTARALRFTLDHSTQMEWQTLRQKILDNFGHPNFTDAPQNIAFTIIGLLYFPDDFEKAILSTTNCGYDTDCTAATLGAIWGLVNGDNFPEHWRKPIGDKILASHGVWDMGLEAGIQDLAERVKKVRGKIERRYKKTTEKIASDWIRERLKNPGKVRLNNGRGPIISYKGDPVIAPEARVTIEGAIKSVSARYPFKVRKSGQNLIVSIDEKADYVPRRAQIVMEDRTGAFHEFSLLTPHQLWVGAADGPAHFPELAKKDPEQLAKESLLKQLDLNDRTLFLKDLPGTEWIHLCGFFHLHAFEKYRMCAFAECPVQTFMDGESLHDVADGKPCIPAPHRYGHGTFVMEIELKAGWRRWDIFLDKTRPVREGKIVLAVAQAYTRQLYDYRFRRKKGGVYDY